MGSFYPYFSSYLTLIKKKKKKKKDQLTRNDPRLVITYIFKLK